jgi:hypothetical protein
MPLLTQEELATLGIEGEDKPLAPTQRLRATAQGGTFATADELEALARSGGLFAPDFGSFGRPTGETYEEAVSDIRGKLGAYKRDYPGEALGAEIAGGLLSGIPLAVATGGASAPTSLLRLGLLGAGSTAAYETGAGEGSLVDRVSGISPVNVALGTALAPALGVAVPAIGRAAVGAGKYLAGKGRSLVGLPSGRADPVVEREIQRILERTDMDLDEVIERVSRGEIIPDMSDSTRDALRGYKSFITDAQRKRLEARPKELRAEADVAVQGGLAQDKTGNVLAQVKLGEDINKKAASDAYDEIFEAYGDVGEEVMPRLNFAVQGEKKVKEAFEDITRTGKPSPFTVTDEGGVILNRTLSLREVEDLSKAFRDLAGQAYRRGAGGAGDKYKELQFMVRGVADDASPDLRQARATWAGIEQASKAFEEGRKAFNKSSDEVEIIFDKVSAQGEDAVEAFRAGLADNYRRKIGPSSGPTFRASLTNLERKDAQVFAKVFPEDTYQETIGALNRAAGAQETMGKVLRGSQTQSSQQEALQQGKAIIETGAEVVGAKIGSPGAIARLASRVVSKFGNKDKLTQEQKRQVVELLVAEDPELLSRALKDSSLMAQVTRRAGQLSNIVSKGGVVPTGALAGDNSISLPQITVTPKGN